MELESIRITDCQLVLPDFCTAGELVIKNGRIAEISTGAGDAQRLNGEQIYTAGGCYVAPGLIDMHMHGFGGIRLRNMNSREQLYQMERAMPAFGTTSYLATLGYDPVALANVTRHMSVPPGGAQMLGTYFEGPFINPKRLGAISERYCMTPQLQMLDRILDEAQGKLKLMTVAPEMDGNLRIIERLVQAGVTPAIGHTLATYEEAIEGFKAGIRHTTHLFNAMTGLSHRLPGAAGAVLASEGITIELIADGIHVHPAVLRLAINIKKPAGVAVITDAIAAAGTVDESHTLLDGRVRIENGAARLADGTLAGSILTPIQALKNTVDLVGVPLHDAVAMLSATPAKITGFDKTKGTLEKGKDADIIIFDRDFVMQATFVAGRLAWERESMSV